MLSSVLWGGPLEPPLARKQVSIILFEHKKESYAYDMWVGMLGGGGRGLRPNINSVLFCGTLLDF